MGSFWEQPLQPSYMAELFEKEASALLSDLAALPRNNTTAKLNDVVTRLRLLHVAAAYDARRAGIVAGSNR